MRYLFALICVLALGVMSCGETTGTGGSGGEGGVGGVGGSGGSAGEGGVGGSIAPEILFVLWSWADPCDSNASGQSLLVLVGAWDDDSPGEQLTYSGQVQDCTPDLNAFDNTLSCDVYLGARQSEAIVTDPQGNADTMFFAPDPCVSDCVGRCPW
jgi:hypothetical protein